MKYLAAALAVLVAATAVIVLRYPDAQPSAGSTAPAASPTARPGAVTTAVAGIPSALPTSAAAVRTRQEALEWGRIIAGSFGEREPVLIDATLLPYSVAAEVLRKPRTPPGDGPLPEAQGVTPETDVWLVRMRGAFVGPAGPDAAAVRVPERGWMYVTINPQTGLLLSRGFRTQTVPVKPIPAQHSGN